MLNEFERQKINKIIEMASEILQSISKDENERFRLLSEYKYAIDHQSKMVQAER
ncbi:MAG: hypothetical protein Ta2B_10890 [Termitinemataceae bacterium]|nr:MAG: hypothetical protein Ta2B_10890 [Termitinemataceae bacterium]